MMLAHYLWERTPRGAAADEGTWLAALDQATLDTAQLMRGIWKALEALIADADVIEDGGRPRLTDPLFEMRLRNRGLTPVPGDD